MASVNPNAPFGYRIIRNRNGDFPQISTRTASANIALPEGGIGYLRTDGTIGLVSGVSTLSKRQIVGPIVAGVTSANTDRTIKVCEDPTVEMEVMLDDGSVVAIADLIGRNFTGASMTTANATLIQSKATLDASTGTSVVNTVSTGTNYRPFRAIRFSTEVGNVTSQSFARVVVRINDFYHAFGGSNVTV